MDRMTILKYSFVRSGIQVQKSNQTCEPSKKKIKKTIIGYLGFYSGRVRGTTEQGIGMLRDDRKFKKS